MTVERTERPARAKELIAEIDAELTKRQGAKTVLEQMRRSALAALRGELDGLARMLSTPRHKLVFIGQVGVGKTTAICHLVGLTAEREKRKKTSKNAPEKAVTVTEDLMATGSGFTTLCEVVVVPAQGSRFVVEPYERAEVERTIAEFCQAVWKREFPDAEEAQKTGAAPEQVNFPTELVRAVRNMVKLPEGDRRDDDAAIKLAREFASGGFDRFKARVLGDAKLDARTQTEFVCPPEESDPRGWIKRTFDALNLASLDTVSIPRRITLHADAAILNAHMEHVASVVDTKGVDAAQFNREDLDRYIRDDDSALCILAEDFKSAPTNVVPLLQRHVTREAPLSMSKFVVLVIPRGSAPEKVVGGQGPVGDRDIGIELRRSQIEETLASQGLPALEHRLVFFDPLLHYEEVGGDNRLRSDEGDEAKAEREAIWEALAQAVTIRENQVWERVTHISESLKRIREGKGLNPAEEALVRQAKQRIAEYAHLNLANADRFLEEYRGLWEGPGGRRAATLRATNNRFGVYPHRNIDIFYDAIPITEKLVRAAASGQKDKIVGIVHEASDQSPEESDLRELLAVLETRIDSAFEEVVRAVAAEVRDYLATDAFHPQDSTNKFWINVQGRYGMGTGYRDDVLSMYAAQLDDHETVLKDAAAESWRKLLIDPVLEYLG